MINVAEDNHCCNLFSGRNFLSNKLATSEFSPSALVANQVGSYNDFLSDSGNYSICSLVKNIFPIVNSFNSVELTVNDICISKPKETIQDCLLSDGTFESNIVANIRLLVYDVDRETGERSIKTIKDQKLDILSIPLMTDSGFFVINGCKKVVTPQIQKSQGVFVSKNEDGDFSVIIIPKRGIWIELFYGQKDGFYFIIDKKSKKIPMASLLKSFGVNISSIYLKCINPIKISTHNDTFCKIINWDLSNSANTFFDIFDGNFNLLLRSGSNLSDHSKKKILNLISQDCAFVKNDSMSNLSLFDEFDINSKIKTINNFTELKDNFYIVDFGCKFYHSSLPDTIDIYCNLSKEQAVTDIVKVIKIGSNFIGDFYDTFSTTLFDPKYYDLSEVGRYKANISLGISNKTSSHLDSEDILELFVRLIASVNGFVAPDNIDSLENRRIRLAGELINSAIQSSVGKFIKTVSEKMSNSVIFGDIVKPSDLLPSSSQVSPIQKAVDDFFRVSSHSQYMDETNPLSELSHKRRITALGSGGINRDMATFGVRDVQYDGFGRICPVETPEGANIGLVSNLALYARINKNGFIETPFKEVIDGAFTNKISYLDPIQEKNKVICSIDSANVAISNFGNLSGDGYVRKDGKFILADLKNVDYVDYSQKQILSVGASSIPFIENDDPRRALMGSNMQRQAVPLVRPERPLVGSGMEYVVGVSSTSTILSQSNCRVVFVSGDNVVTKDIGSDVDEFSLRYYNLSKFRRTNNGTCVNNLVKVSVGDVLSKGDLIADGCSTDNCDLALGSNVLVAFMCFDGCGFEDSIIVSSRIVEEDKYTSITLKEFVTTIQDTRIGPEEITRDVPGATEDSLKSLDQFGVVKVGSKVNYGDILVGKITPQNDSPVTPEEKLIKAIFGDRTFESKDSSLRVPAGISGVVTDVVVLNRRGYKKSDAVIHYEQSMIRKLSREKLSYTNLLNSTFIENLLQIDQSFSSEIYYKNDIIDVDKLLLVVDSSLFYKVEDLVKKYKESLGSLNLDYDSKIRRVVDGYDLKYGGLTIVKISVASKRKLQPGDKMSGRHGNKGVVSVVIPKEDMPFMEDGTPIDMILNPLGVIARMNVGQILENNLGFACASIGKEISKSIDLKDVDGLKSTLKKFCIDKDHIKYFDVASDAEILKYANYHKKGLIVASPAFDGIGVDKIKSIISKLPNLSQDGKYKLRDGRTGEYFDGRISVGYNYILKLHHLVEDKIHARSTGPYNLINQQPLGGKAQFGGQRFGEMEVWALEGYGAAYNLREMLTIKSDDTEGRRDIYRSIVKGENSHSFNGGVTSSFGSLFRNIEGIGLTINLID